MGRGVQPNIPKFLPFTVDSFLKYNEECLDFAITEKVNTDFKIRAEWFVDDWNYNQSMNRMRKICNDDFHEGDRRVAATDLAHGSTCIACRKAYQKLRYAERKKKHNFSSLQEWKQVYAKRKIIKREFFESGKVGDDAYRETVEFVQQSRAKQ